MLTVGGASAGNLSNQPATILFPVTRGSSQAYDTAIGYHAIAGTAVAGADYTTPPGTFTLAAAAASATIPVTLNADTRSGASVAFQLQLDNASRIGPPPAFAAQSPFATGSFSYSVAAADINGDGRADLIVANYGVDTVSVLLNTTAPGAATPAFAAHQTFATESHPVSVATTDVNGDGRADVIVANYSGGNVSVLLNTTAPGAATPTFAAQQIFATGSGPFSVATTDVNGDGKADLIVANVVADTVSVLLNTTAPGAATPTFAAQQTFAVSDPSSVAASDVNGDGKTDLVVANASANKVSVLLNTTAPGAATPGFAAGQTFATGSYPRCIAAADINGDGKSDLIAANYLAHTISVLLNTTAPGAATPAFAAQQAFAAEAGSLPISVAPTDLNGDGKADLVVANYGNGTVSVLLNTTAPGAAAPSFAEQQAFAASSYSVAAADVNGDGVADLIATSDATVSVLLNTTAPGAATAEFAGEQAVTAGASPASVATTDVNGDGKADLIVANLSTATVSVRLNATAPGGAAPAFGAAQAFATGAGPIAVQATDVNGDGRADLIVANADDATVSVLLNTTAPGAKAPDFADQQAFTAGSLPYSVAAADINGDGRADLIVANSGAATLSVLLNTTTPGAAVPAFAGQQTFATGPSPSSVATVDVNGDGTVDLIAANFNSDSVSVLLNTTAPGAATPAFAAQQTFATGFHPLSVAAADVNGDGRVDVMAANYAAGSASVLLNATAPGAAMPSFVMQQAFPTGDSPHLIAAADVDGDGRNDLITANFISNTLSVLLNTTAPGAATPSFGTQQTFPTGLRPGAVAAADLNGDGNADLIAANNSDSTVSVLLNATYRAPITGDLATGTILLDKIFHDGVERPLVNCAGTTSYADYLIEDFAGPSLDPLRWTQNTNGGTVVVGGNSVALGSSGGRFPYITSLGAPIPATGAFSIRWDATYTKAAGRGDGTLVISKGVPANGPNDSYALRRADVWQDTTNGYELRLRTTDAGGYTTVSAEKPPLLVAHDVEYCWLAATIEYWIDGTRVFQQPRDAGLSRPDALWFGNPFDAGGPAAWSEFTLRSVHVRSVSP